MSSCWFEFTLKTTNQFNYDLLKVIVDACDKRGNDFLFNDGYSFESVVYDMGDYEIVAFAKMIKEFVETSLKGTEQEERLNNFEFTIEGNGELGDGKVVQFEVVCKDGKLVIRNTGVHMYYASIDYYSLDYDDEFSEDDIDDDEEEDIYDDCDDGACEYSDFYEVDDYLKEGRGIEGWEADKNKLDDLSAMFSELKNDIGWLDNLSCKKYIEESSKEELESVNENLAKEIMRDIWNSDDGSLKRLLFIHTRDCLSTKDAAILKNLEKMTYDLACEKNYIRFNPEDISSGVDGCCIIFRIEEEVNHDVANKISLTFDVFCNNQIIEIDDFKARHIEIGAILNEKLNRKEIAGIGKIYYSSCIPHSFTEDYSVCIVTFKQDNSKYLEGSGVNVIAEYATINKAIAQAIAQDEKCRNLLDVKDCSAETLYSQGYFTVEVPHSLNIEKGLGLRVGISWAMPFGTYIAVEPVCQILSRHMESGEERHKAIVTQLKNLLNDLSIGSGIKLVYKPFRNDEEINLSDGFVATLRFEIVSDVVDNKDDKGGNTLQKL